MHGLTATANFFCCCIAWFAANMLRLFVSIYCPRSLHVQVRGSITYNGETFDSFQVARTSAYISQDDNHQAELTVRETLDFAARCLGVAHKQGEPTGWLPHYHQLLINSIPAAGRQVVCHRARCFAAAHSLVMASCC
jgi:hypothetical protein